MRKLPYGALLGLLLAGLCSAQDKKPEDGKSPPLTPTQEYAKLVKDFSDSRTEFFKKYSAATTSEEKQALVQNDYPRPDKWADKFMALAKKNPDDPAAVKALTWIASNAGSTKVGQEAVEQLMKVIEKNPDDPAMFGALVTIATRSRGPGADKALNLLKEKCIDNAQLATVCTSLVYNTTPQVQDFLRTVLAKSPHKEVQVAACYALGKVLMRTGPDSADEAEKLFERVVTEFKDVKVRGRSLAQSAEGALFELRYLSIGKVAPDIEGEDLDGALFKVSDYRGKVVVLDFWGNW